MARDLGSHTGKVLAQAGYTPVALDSLPSVFICAASALCLALCLALRLALRRCAPKRRALTPNHGECMTTSNRQPCPTAGLTQVLVTSEGA